MCERKGNDFDMEKKINQLADWLAKMLVKQELISESEKEEYLYGLHLAVLKLFNWLLLLIIICFLPQKIGSILFLVFLFLLRGQTGGLHASTSMRCAIGGCAILLVANYIVMLLKEGNLLWVVAAVFLSCIVILIYAPVDHPNLGLSEYERKMCRRNVKIILNIELLCILLTYFVSRDGVIILYECLAIIMCAFFILTGRRKKNEEQNA